jgi:hypothetical protein
MGDGNEPNQVGHHALKCSRCPKTISVGEKYITLTINLEMPDEQGRIAVLEFHDLTKLCFGCASALLAQSVVRRNMLEPDSLLDKLVQVKKQHSLQKNAENA